MAKCRICGAPHRSCGPATTVVPVDSNITTKEQLVGLKRYDVVLPGRNQVKTTLLLSDEDAKAAGLIPAKAAPAPSNKARTPRNKAAAKPAANKPEPAVDDASDPGASE